MEKNERSILSDLAISTGATFISRESGNQLKSVKLEHFGSAQTIESDKRSTIVVGGNQDDEAVEKRIGVLKNELILESSLNVCEGIQERISRLTSAIAVIKVGGATEIEMLEKKHRVEDALEAVHSAQQEGIIPGGSAALLRVSKKVTVITDTTEQQIGVDIIKEAIKEPFKKMVSNAGMSPDIYLDKVENHTNPDSGLDVTSGEIVNMFTYGIIDPFKVIRCALPKCSKCSINIINYGCWYC